MALSTEIRRSERYKGDGQNKRFPFPFKLFDPVHVSVVISENGLESATLSDRFYHVQLNENQDNSPGGVVTLDYPLEQGKTLVVVSNVPYIQESVFKNLGGFYPEHLNKVHDLLTMQTQQLKELLSRALTLPVTEDKTPQQAMREILDIAAKANEYAENALRTYEEVKKVHEIMNATSEETAKAAKQVAESQKIVEQIAEAIEKAKQTVMSHKTALSFIEEHQEDFLSISKQLNDLRVVASDLLGLLLDSIDLGFTREENVPINRPEKTSSIRTVAENIDEVKNANASVETIKETAELIANYAIDIKNAHGQVEAIRDETNKTLTETKTFVTERIAENTAELDRLKETIFNACDEYIRGV